MIECKICGNKLTLNSMRIHTKKQHCLTYGQYKEKFNENIIIKCNQCNKILKNVHPNKKFCNDECYEEFKKKKKLRLSEEKYKDIKDIPTCVICGVKGLNLTAHLNNIHNISVPNYYKKYNLSKLDVYHQSYLNSIGTSGENNPAYNHGGILSPFSKKFLHYNEEKRQSVIKKAAKNRTYSVRREYYLRDAQFNYDLSDWLLKQRQTTFSKDICIKKYGKEKGLKVWKERQNKWLSNYKRLNYSKISQELFWQLYEIIKNKYNDVYFAQLGNRKGKDISGKNYEYKINIGDSYCKVDFLIKNINKIIEFDGDYWHGEVRGNIERDKQRDKKLNEKGYKVLHIRERDYKSNSIHTIQKCLEFIND